MARDLAMARGYQGPAPAPTRRISLSDPQNQAYGGPEEYVVGEPQLLRAVGPEHPNAGPPGRQTVQASPPPADPATAQELLQLRQQLGEAIGAMGSQRTNFEAMLEEQRLNFELQMLHFQSQFGGPASGMPQLTEEQANQPVTMGGLAQILGLNNQNIEAAMIRRSWDVTPQEEQEALTLNPTLVTLSEPQKTTLIQRAVALRRRQRAPAATTAASPSATAPAAVPQSAPVHVRPLAPSDVVPLVETGSPQVGDAVAMSDYEKAMHDYQAADQIPNRAQRLQAKKNAYKRAQFALGISDEALAKTPFTSGVGR